jgi:hypothetical protein
LPSWLSFLRAIPLVRTMDSFGVMFWYYAQLDRIGKGKPVDPNLSVFAAMREVDAFTRRMAREIRDARTAA